MLSNCAIQLCFNFFLFLFCPHFFVNIQQYLFTSIWGKLILTCNTSRQVQQETMISPKDIIIHVEMGIA